MRAFAFAALLALIASTPAAAMDCEKEFRVRVDRMMGGPTYGSSLTQDVIRMTRFMVQGYDACMKGDTKAAQDYFERAMRSGG